jgi:hypothetical protein
MLQVRNEPHFGETSKLLCSAILNFAFLQAPGNEDAIQFLDDNQCLIEQQAQLIHNDAELAYAFSVLYSFMLVQLGPRDPDRTLALAERSTSLRIWLRTTNEIYPTNDALEFLTFVRAYAEKLLAG